MTGSSQPRVLHVLEAVEGGTARHVVDILRHVHEVEHEVALPAARSSGVTDHAAIAEIHASAAAVHLLPLRRGPLSAGNVRSFAALRHLVQGRRPSILHGHSSVGGALARFGAGTTPTVYTPNGVTPSRGYLLIERALGRRTTAFVAVSESEAHLVRELRLVAPDRIRTIPNGIDLELNPTGDEPDVRHHLGLAPGTPLVGTVARLVPQKAPDAFVRACAEVGRMRPDVHFVLIGSGPLQAALDAAARASGLRNRFHQIRELPSAALVLGQFDVFTLLSKFEGAPYTPLEAMRAAVPVVLSDVVGNRDVVEHGVSGFTVPLNSPRKAADAITRLLDDAELRSRVVAAGRWRLDDRFDVRLMARRIADLYLAIAAGGSGTQDFRQGPQVP